jgi:DNA-binding MarR family transcriptional regulator
MKEVLRMNELELIEKLQRLMWLAYCYQEKSQQTHGPLSDPSKGQGRVLAALKMQPEMSTKDLTYLLGIRPQSLNELLGKLEKNGYITRAQAENDRRIVLVKLTEKGEEEEQKSPDFSDLLDCLATDEQEAFGAYLDRINAALEKQLDFEPDPEEYEWLSQARERFGDGLFDRMSQLRGGMPFGRGGFGPRGGFGRGPREGGGRGPREGGDPRGFGPR